MLSRRRFLARSLATSSLLATAPTVPGFLAATAQAAETGKDTVLVVVELTGGNDGLNTVIPYADDRYHQARPTLRFTREQVLRVDDQVGLHPALGGLNGLLQRGQLAIVQGVGYPNPDRSHFESMDIWQSGDVRRTAQTGWLARGVTQLQDDKGNVPLMQVGASRLPLALQGAPGGVASIHNGLPYRLELGAGEPAQLRARRGLLEDLAKPTEGDGLLQFVQRRQTQTYTSLDRLQEVLQSLNQGRGAWNGTNLGQKLSLVARLIEKGFGTRVFYVSLDGFDTHANQAEAHRKLLEELGGAVGSFFTELSRTGHDKRVLVLTFSEFGRRVGENGSRGTDHGSGSCLFVAGPAVQAGPVTKHPDLGNLDAGDLRWHTDFRRVYATLLDGWLHCDSKTILGGSFEPLKLLKKA